MKDEELKARVELMRELGILQCDGIVLGPAPMPAGEALPAPSKEDLERAAYEDLFYSSGSPVEPFLQKKD